LVLIETALGVVVMIGAGLLLRSFVRLGTVPLGFQPQNVLTLRVLPRGVRYPDFYDRLNFYQQVLAKVQNVAGVESAGAVSFLPLTHTRQFNTFSIEGHPLANTSWSPSADIRTITPGYLEAMKLTLIAGRKFYWQDAPESAPVAIVSQRFVQNFFPDGSAIGSHIKIGNLPSSSSWWTIVGVVDDVPYFDIVSPAQPTIYVPYAQTADLHTDLHDLAVRTKQRPASVTGAVRDAIRSVDSSLAVSRVRTMEDVYSISTAPQRFNLLLLTLMAALVLFLAAIGLYGVTAYSVAQRTREIGVRLVLGAAPVHVLRLILFHSGALLLFGVTAGIILSFPLTSLMKNLLFNVSALDPVTYGLVAALLCLVGLVACYGPARAATRIDPITALRYE
jgi:predicted permease